MPISGDGSRQEGERMILMPEMSLRWKAWCKPAAKIPPPHKITMILPKAVCNRPRRRLFFLRVTEIKPTHPKGASTQFVARERLVGGSYGAVVDAIFPTETSERAAEKSPAWRLLRLYGHGTDAPAARTTGNGPFILSADGADESSGRLLSRPFAAAPRRQAGKQDPAGFCQQASSENRHADAFSGRLVDTGR